MNAFIPKLNLGAMSAARSEQVDGFIDAQFILADLERNPKLDKFVGSFQLLYKCEEGTKEFKEKCERLCAQSNGAVERLSRYFTTNKALTDTELKAVHEFVSRNAVPGSIGAVFQLITHFHASKAGHSGRLADTLIECLLKPTLKKLV
jgi:hypothetical protein